jgi:GTP-binding protein HflX
MIKSLLLSLSLPSTNQEDLIEEIEEMKRLANTLGYSIESTSVQNKQTIDSATFFGKGKIQNIVNQCKELKYNTVFINDELEPGHYKRIQKIAGDKIFIIDRTKLILDIFTRHAKTIESKKQVELASVQYMKPRLIGQWTHLERQMGGVGTRGGPGEKQIEIDRRLLRTDINKLKNDLLKIEKQRITQRKSRSNVFKVALVGYTNAGKSSIFKNLSGYKTYIKDELFATLDTTTKSISLDDKNKILLSDTVGFLRNLPTDLIASFRSTLGEIKDADLLLKIIDISSTDITGHINTIEDTLKILECNKKKSIIVFNKIDKIDKIKENNLYIELKVKYKNALFISSIKKLNINILIKSITQQINKNLKIYTIKLKYDTISIIDYIYTNTNVLKREDEYNYIKLSFRTSTGIYNKILKKCN